MAKISIEIALAGGAEIKRQLQDIGEEGQKAFGKIAKSAEQVGGFKNLDTATVKAQLQDLGITSVAQINKIQSAVQAAGRLEGIVAGVRAVEGAFSRLGAVFGPVGAAVEKFGKTMTRSLGPLGAAARALGPIGLAAGAVVGASAALIKFATSAEETATALTQLQKVSGQSFESLSSLSSVFAQGGTSVKEFASVFGDLSQKIQEAAQTKAIRDASKDSVDWANNVDQVRQKFDNLAAGVPQSFSKLTTLQTKVEAVLESLAKVKDPAERWLRLAEIFRNLGSELERQQLGKALAIPPDMISTLTQGAAAIKQLQAEAASLGFTLTTSNQQALKELMDAWNQFSTLVGEAFRKIGATTAPALTKILNDLKSVLTQIVKDFETLPLSEALAKTFDRLTPVFEKIGKTLEPIATKVGEVLGAALAAGIQKGIKSLTIGKGLIQFDPELGEANREKLRNQLKTLWDAIMKEFGGSAQAAEAPGAAEGMAQGLLQSFEQAFAQLKERAQQAGEEVMQALQAGFTSASGQLDFSELATGFSNLLSAARSAGEQIGTAFSTALQAAVSAANGSLDRLVDRLNEIIREIERAAEKAERIRGGGGGGGGGESGIPLAGGGFIGGRGTGTSDSNLAWVSRGEHIMPARAVAQPGVLAFLEALRRSGGNLSRVLDGMGRFALGGVVPRRALAFADGGLVGGGSRRALTLNIEGRSFSGLSVPESTAQALERFAVHSQLASTGRKPSWRR